MTRLLVMACSATKTREPGAVAAYLRYDGSGWRTWRAAHARIPLEAWPTTIVLSAEFGLMGDCREIPAYDRRLDRARADELVADRRHVEMARHYFRHADELAVFGGALYRETLARLLEAAELAPRLRPFLGRGIGDQLSGLKAWLEEAGR